MNHIVYPDIKGVIFDAFGTIAYRSKITHPYQEFMDSILSTRYPSDRAAVMSRNFGLGGIAQDVFVQGIPLEIGRMERAVMDEAASVRAFPGTQTMLAGLRNPGRDGGNAVKVGICSNLAAPYGVPIKVLFEDSVDFMVLSYEVGTVKPEPLIYEKCLAEMAKFNIQPNEVLFVGDTDSADYEGPKAAGMHARPLEFWDKFPSNPYGNDHHFANKAGVYIWFHNEHASTQALARAKLRDQY